MRTRTQKLLEILELVLHVYCAVVICGLVLCPVRALNEAVYSSPQIFGGLFYSALFIGAALAGTEQGRINRRSDPRSSVTRLACP